jgi:hypothetical protein
MKVLVVSEGKHEQSGALENLLVKLGAVRETLEFDRVSNRTIHAFHGKGRGYFKRALCWLKEAKEREANALILLIDEDGRSERITEIRDAQDYHDSQLARAMGVAIRTFDAWMLADETALSKVLGNTVDRQPNPETIRDPKETCAGLLKDRDKQISQSQMYAEVSGKIDIDVLCDRCQRGFKPFAARVKSVFQRA